MHIFYTFKKSKASILSLMVNIIVFLCIFSPGCCYWIGFCHNGPISLCVDLFVFVCICVFFLFHTA